MQKWNECILFFMFSDTLIISMHIFTVLINITVYEFWCQASDAISTPQSLISRIYFVLLFIFNFSLLLVPFFVGVDTLSYISLTHARVSSLICIIKKNFYNIIWYLYLFNDSFQNFESLFNRQITVCYPF